MDIFTLNRTAVLESVRLVGLAAPEDWELLTPCAGWTLRTLVSHMAGQHLGFAAAAAGRGSDLAVWQPVELGGDPAAAYSAAAGTVLDAFTQPDARTRDFDIPEISTDFRLPASLAIGFHFLDYVVHGWDVARTLGVELELDDDVIEAALGYALRVPDDERRLGEDAAFAPALSSPAGASTADRLLTALGRSPEWTSAAVPR